ncbi:MAG: YgaP family membrane protein [Pontibacterium sp.]
MKNVGNLDKTLRIVLGLALLSLVFVGPKTLFGLVGIIFIVTGLINFCPLYRIFSIRTNKE